MHKITHRHLIPMFFILLCLFSGVLAAKNLNICVDDADWIPFIYIKDGEHKGIHIETIKKSLDKLSINYQFHSVPWKRCLKGLEKGRYDAVATASYKDDRAEYLWYPKDANSSPQSHWRVSQVEYVITLPSKSNFVYAGDPFTIPQPVRVPRGFSIGDDLRKLGIKIDSSALSDLQNIKRMLRSQSGSVITLPTIISWLNEKSEYQGLLKSDPTTLKSKSYFFAISKAGQLTLEQANQVWDSIAAIRTLQQRKPQIIEPQHDETKPQSSENKKVTNKQNI